MREHRYKLAHVNPLVMLSIFTSPPFKGPTVGDPLFLHRQVQLVGVPEDAEVTGINYDHMRGSFAIQIYHESFPIVPDGEMLPLVQVTTREVTTNQKGEILSTCITNHDSPREKFDSGIQTGLTWRDQPPLF